MAELTQTDVPHTRIRPSDTIRLRRHPLDLFADHGAAARLWCAVALIAVGFCVIQPFLIIRAYRTQERVVVLDPGGTFHVSPLLGFEDASKLHEEHALLACLALFQRNPQGFDQPELLERLFLADALQQARQEIAASAEEFSQKSLHQKAEVQRLTVLETREDRVLVEAQGQLVRTGVVGTQAFTEAPTFTARFTFARNPNLTANGRFPLAVWSYDTSF
jgi:hypothetical protein